MSRLIIHIGLHKTATTYLQHYVIPQLKGVINAHVDHFFRNWTKQLDSNNHHLVISYEGFSGMPWNHDWKTGVPNEHSWLKSFKLNIKKLSLMFPDAAIFVLFRKHGDLLISLYKQYVQEGGVLPLQEFYGNGKVISPDDLSIQKRIEIIKNLFSQAHFLNFETYKKMGDSYLKEYFEKVFSIQMESNSIQSEKRNKSISGWKVESLRRINKYYYNLPQKLIKLASHLQWSPRDIMQHRLSFLKTKDNEEMKNLRESVNNKFTPDWNYFLKHEWKP